MEDEQILLGIKEVLSSTFRIKVENIKMESSLDEDLGLDSVDIMDSIGLFEAKFGISITDGNLADSPKVRTVEHLVNIVKKSNG